MRRIVLLLIMIGVALLLASGVALAAALSSSPDPRTVQTDGAVRTILRVGSKVYIGGSFTSVAGKPEATWQRSTRTLAGSPAGHPRPTARCVP